MNPILADIYSTILPSAPYIIAAYALLWVALLAYVLIIFRGTKKAEAQLMLLEEAVAALVTRWPRMGLGADILVGFPGETDKDLRLLLELIERLPLSYAHVFPYSRRPGTAADSFTGHLPQAVKLGRAALAREAVARRHQRFLQDQLDLPHMLVAADTLKRLPSETKRAAAENATVHGSGAWRKGVNEFYAPCLFRFPAADGASQADRPTGLLPARPVRVTEKGLLVELKTTEA